MFNIMEFGAIADGKTINSNAFHRAVEACVQAGGGTVYVPAGKFLTGPIHLANNITLFVEAGARILFSQDPKDYPLVYSRWEGVYENVYSPLIYGKDLENVTVTGRGVLDGQGEPWWQLHSEKKLEFPRPRFISFENSRNILIEGVTLVNSPAWTINPINCFNVTIDKITIVNPAASPNTDGINPDSCQNVHISNCHVDVGDDCITLKSGTEACSNKIPCENITITNCTMVHGHGGVVIGSEMSGGVRNVVISNCIFEGTDRGIRLKSRRGRGGVIEDIRVNNIIMNKVICPFIMNLYYHCGPGGKEPKVRDKNPHPVTEETPLFRRIHLSNITAREVQAAAAFIYGLPEMPVEEVSFTNISIHLAQEAKPAYPAMMCNLEPVARQGVFCCNAKDVIFDWVKVEGQDGPAFKIIDSSGVVLTGCATKQDSSNGPAIVVENVEPITIKDCKVPEGNLTGI